MIASWERVSAVGERLDLAGLPWLLVVGGATRPGNRRSRRLCAEAASLGFPVVWIDGFGERDRDGQRVPIEVSGSEPDHPIRIVECAEALELEVRSGPGFRCAELLDDLAGRLAPLRGPLRWAARFARRAARAGRGGALWRIIDRSGLLDDARPYAIVHADEFALATAWRLHRRWPDVMIGPDLPASSLDGSVES